MYGMALACAGLALLADPSEPPIIYEAQARQFLIPFQLAPEQLRNVKRLHLFASEDQGETWDHAADFKPRDESVRFVAPRDGLYWFAVQEELTNGAMRPADLSALKPLLKVRVNTAPPPPLDRIPPPSTRIPTQPPPPPPPPSSPLPPPPDIPVTFAELRREVEELHDLVDRLRLQLEVEQLRTAVQELQQMIHAEQEKHKSR